MAARNPGNPPDMAAEQQERIHLLESCLALVEKWTTVKVMVKKLPVTEVDMAQMHEYRFWRELNDDDTDDDTNYKDDHDN